MLRTGPKHFDPELTESNSSGDANHKDDCPPFYLARFK